MKKPNHAPLPWHGENTDIYDANSIHLCEISTDELDNGIEIRDLIVRAVNSHNELLEILKEVREYLIDYIEIEMDHGLPLDHTKSKKTLKKLDKAITEAEKTP